MPLHFADATLNATIFRQRRLPPLRHASARFTLFRHYFDE